MRWKEQLYEGTGHLEPTQEQVAVRKEWAWPRNTFLINLKSLCGGGTKRETSIELVDLMWVPPQNFCLYFLVFLSSVVHVLLARAVAKAMLCFMYWECSKSGNSVQTLNQHEGSKMQPLPSRAPAQSPPARSWWSSVNQMLSVPLHCYGLFCSSSLATMHRLGWNIHLVSFYFSCKTERVKKKKHVNNKNAFGNVCYSMTYLMFPGFILKARKF